MATLPLLGLDIGSVSVSAAVVDAYGSLLRSSYLPHNGKVRETLTRTIRVLDVGQVAGLGVTGSGPVPFPLARRLDGTPASSVPAHGSSAESAPFFPWEASASP
jgi:predicted NBD/HSP70 family sugar kinase